MEPGANDNAALRRAAEYGHVRVVKLLCELPLERGVEPGANDNQALQQAAECGHMNIVHYLCKLPPERGVDPRANDNQALRAAKAKGRAHCCFHDHALGWTILRNCVYHHEYSEFYLY